MLLRVSAWWLLRSWCLFLLLSYGAVERNQAKAVDSCMQNVRSKEWLYAIARTKSCPQTKAMSNGHGYFLSQKEHLSCTLTTLVSQEMGMALLSLHRRQLHFNSRNYGELRIVHMYECHGCAEETYRARGSTTVCMLDGRRKQACAASGHI